MATVQPVDTSSYLARLEQFRVSDKARDDMVQELVQKYEEIRLRYDEKCGDYDNEVQARRYWYNESKTLKDQLDDHKRVVVRRDICPISTGDV